MSDRRNGYWHLFNSAAEDMRELEVRMESRDEAVAWIAETAGRLLDVSQRFYLPDGGGSALAGRQYDDALKEMIQLPYEAIAVLREVRHEGAETKHWCISLAVEANGAISHELELCKSAPDAGSMIVLSLNRIMGKWICMPSDVLVTPNHGVGYSVRARDVDSPSFRSIGYTPEMFAKEFQSDFHCISNLCVLLNTLNIGKRAFPPPQKVDKRRAKKGKRPLYDYHVLEVDGEIWDSPFTTVGTGSGVRSHLRRGHIRRLAVGRTTWVRATFVHGSVPGFVDKDYDMRKVAH